MKIEKLLCNIFDTLTHTFERLCAVLCETLSIERTNTNLFVMIFFRWHSARVCAGVSVVPLCIANYTMATDELHCMSMCLCCVYGMSKYANAYLWWTSLVLQHQMIYQFNNNHEVAAVLCTFVSILCFGMI